MESLIASSILSFAVLAVLQPIVAGQSQSTHALNEMRALALAEAMIEEVLSRPYFDPDGASVVGPDGGETNRTQFDNIDDYHGFTEAVGQVRDANNQTYPITFNRFGRSVTCAYTTQDLPDLGGVTSGIVITVTVRDNASHTWELARFVPEPGVSE